jgi:serine/threonine protein kinase
MPLENQRVTVTYNDCRTCLEDHLFFVMEYVSGGDLLGLLHEVDGGFSEKRTQFYAVEITLAMHFLHRHGILHR